MSNFVFIILFIQNFLITYQSNNIKPTNYSLVLQKAICKQELQECYSEVHKATMKQKDDKGETTRPENFNSYCKMITWPYTLFEGDIKISHWPPGNKNNLHPNFTSRDIDRRCVLASAFQPCNNEADDDLLHLYPKDVAPKILRKKPTPSYYGGLTVRTLFYYFFSN